MTPKPLLHPLTTQALASFADNPGHALLLVAPTGSGKMLVANQLVADLLQIAPESVASQPYVKHIQKDKERSISIEQIRLLEGFLSRKVPGGARRIVLIEDAHLLGIDAQNALLKTLEEPPMGTIVLLTVAQERALLPTIRSRASAVAIRRPTQADTSSYFAAQGFAAPAVQRAYAMSGGLPGLMHAVLADDSDHPLVQAATTARQLAGASTFDRLAMVDALAKDREHCLEVLGVLQQMARVTLRSGNATPVWQRILTGCHEASSQLLKSGQPKLVLTNLMLSL